MKNSLTFLLVLFTFSGLFGQTDCRVKIIYSMNKSLPPSYTFKTDPQPDSVKYSWSFGDKTYSDSPTPTHTFKITDSYVVFVKVLSQDGKVCYGELKERFEGGTSTNTTTTITGKGKVKDMSANTGCGLVIIMENGTVLVPAEIVPTFQLKDGQYLELAYELLRDKPSACPTAISAKIHKISEIIQPTVCKIPIAFTKSNTTPASYTFKTETQPEGSIYSWTFGDGGTSALATPTHSFKTTGSYLIILKVVKDNKGCYGEMKDTFIGESNPILSGRGKVKNLASTEGCGLVIVLEKGDVLVPVEMLSNFLLN